MTDEWSMLALAGPANRQGRIAADVIAGRDAHFRGVQGTAIVGLFGGALAWTGVSEKTLQRLGDDDYEKVYLFPNSHAGYYPDALPIAMKVIFRKSDGRLLGAQAVGRDGVDKRIDALAVAIQLGGTIHDLEEAELCYAPQFGSAKSPANFAGMVAGDVLGGDMPVAHWGDLDGEFLLDVRHPEELAAEALPGVVNIPVDQLRGRLDELPRDREHRRHLPLRPARLLRDAHPPAERLRRARHVGRDALARDLLGGVTRAVPEARGGRCGDGGPVPRPRRRVVEHQGGARRRRTAWWSPTRASSTASRGRGRAGRSRTPSATGGAARSRRAAACSPDAPRACGPWA